MKALVDSRQQHRILVAVSITSFIIIANAGMTIAGVCRQGSNQGVSPVEQTRDIESNESSYTTMFAEATSRQDLVHIESGSG